MLIRICDHFKDNPKRIDKLIAIKGLPDEWLFRETPEGRELKKPWEPDIDANVPHDIRGLCDPMYIVMRYPALQAGAQGVLEKRRILGIRIDYNSEPGREMWDQVERFMEESIPRHERIPVPVICARDERSAFDTYTPRRNSRGSLELSPSPVPMVDLTKYSPILPETVQVPEVIAPEPLQKQPVQDSEYHCDEPGCIYHNASQQGIRMHKNRRHPKKEKVTV